MHSFSRVPRWILFALMLIPTIAHAWQQEVHYTMDIRLDAEHHSYDGTQRLVYTNNSPDTLREVYYHLYYEAFKPGSMMDVRDNSIPNGTLGIAQLLPDEQGEVKVGTLTQDGRQVTWSLDETILHVTLARPLLPGDSTLLEMAWHTHIPRLLRRGGWMSREGIEYSMSQWYPKMVEYDRNGWHDDEYVRREFYGVYGTFDVSISLPAKYVVGGTGVVTNPREVGCGYELGAVDTTILAPASGSGTKTWKFHAENVHDFAWVADPDYLHKITRWQNVTIHILASRYLASLWRSSDLWTAAIMDYYSARFGRYAWPQFTVAMAGDGGMEYPQLIMITGNRTPGSLAGVVAHELGHQWYYGMIGNNETQEAWMDEGFTQYLTDEASRNVLQIQGGSNPYTGLNRIVYPWTPGRWANVEDAYRQAAEGFDEPLNTYHDRFREDATSGLVYSKGEAVLRMVQYMFGDSLFDAAMRHYYDRWKFHHPDARDFERSMEEASGMRLDWFFNEWIGSRKLCDYAVDDLESDRSGSGYATTIDLSNRNEAIMPLDVTLTYDDGSTAIANIPVENWRKPKMDFNLPRWKWTSRSYRETFITPHRVVRATIDTSVIMLDIDRTNNSFGTDFLANLLPPSQAAFYRRWDFHRPLDFYSIRLRPTLWYGEKDGAQLGFVADGGYAFDRYNAKAGIYFNFLSKRVDYDLRYGSTLGILGRDASYALLATNADGVQRWGASVSKRIRPFYYSTQQNHTVTVGAEREVLVGPAYPNAMAPWTGGGFNTLSLGYSFAGNFRESNLTARGSFDFDASFASASEFTQWRLAAGTSWNPGTFAFGGEMFLGASLGAPPAQRLFNPAGATSREMHLNETNRLMMNINPGFAARNHLVLPTQGDLFSLASLDPAARLTGNLLTTRVTMGNINPFAQFAIFGGKKVPYLEKIDLKVYAAGGWIFGDAITWKRFSDFNYEGGLMASVDLLRTFLPDVVTAALDAPAPLRLNFILPLYAKSDLLDRNGFAYRWAIGVSM